MRRFLLAFSILTIIYLALTSCNSDDPTAPVDVPAKVLILDDVGSQDSLFKILDSAGCDVTLGGNHYNYTGTNFSGYDLVIILAGVSYDPIDDSIQTALRNYVQSGGVMLTTEMRLIQDADSILQSIIPLQYNGTGTTTNGIQTYLKVTANAITAGVPDSFDTRAGWGFNVMSDHSAALSTNHIVLFNGKVGGPALAIGTYGSGRAIHWSMTCQRFGANIWSTEVRRLFINIANFSKTI